MSLLTIRVPIPGGRAVNAALLGSATRADRARTATIGHVRGLRVVSTEPPGRAPVLQSLVIAGYDRGARASTEARIATLANDVRPDQPCLNEVDCGVAEGSTLGGNSDWMVRSLTNAPVAGIVLTFFVTLDD